ncbi:MAG: glycerol-3-phosphate dehydrogenase C-terminal domain-containing protein, partial [Pontibacterium sp.]
PQDFLQAGSSDAISAEEIEYVIEVSNAHFNTQVSPSDVVSSYSGVRPLMDDESDNAQAVTRDYTFDVDAPVGKAPLLSIFGGKITTYRKLAQSAVDAVCEFFPEVGPQWTAEKPLPGGDFDTKDALEATLSSRYPWLSENIIKRYVRCYGTIALDILSDTKNLEGMGEHFGAGLYSIEVDYLVQKEWAITVEDIIWRRTKLALFMKSEEKAKLAEYLAAASVPII